jgi:hypothetical protein
MTYDTKLRYRDAWFYPEEVMGDREIEAKEMGYTIRYYPKDNRVWLFHSEGEGGSFNLKDFIASPDDVDTYFHKNF